MGTPKSSILIACSILNYPFRGPPFMEPPICDWAMTLQDQTSWKQSLAQCRLCRRSRIERSIWNGPNCLSQISFIIMVTIVVIVDFTRIIVMILYIYMLHEYNKFKMFFQILEWNPAECASKFLDDGFEPGCHATSPLRSMAENSCDHDPSRSGIHLTHGRQGTVGWLGAS